MICIISLCSWLPVFLGDCLTSCWFCLLARDDRLLLLEAINSYHCAVKRQVLVWWGQPPMQLCPCASANLRVPTCAQAAGFLVLVAGTLVYAQGDRKQEEEERQKEGPLQVPTADLLLLSCSALLAWVLSSPACVAPCLLLQTPLPQVFQQSEWLGRQLKIRLPIHCLATVMTQPHRMLLMNIGLTASWILGACAGSAAQDAAGDLQIPPHHLLAPAA